MDTLLLQTLSTVEGAFAAGSAIFWIQASRVRLPMISRASLAEMDKVAGFTQAAISANLWNAFAAMAAASRPAHTRFNSSSTAEVIRVSDRHRLSGEDPEGLREPCSHGE